MTEHITREEIDAMKPKILEYVKNDVKNVDKEEAVGLYTDDFDGIYFKCGDALTYAMPFKNLPDDEWLDMRLYIEDELTEFTMKCYFAEFEKKFGKNFWEER